MSSKEKVNAFLHGLYPDHQHDFQEDTELIQSGILDSLALFKLAIWIEKETKSSIDPTEFDVGKEWATITSIASFMQKKSQKRESE